MGSYALVGLIAFVSTVSGLVDLDLYLDGEHANPICHTDADCWITGTHCDLHQPIGHGLYKCTLPVCDWSSPRSIDGSCNNLNKDKTMCGSVCYLMDRLVHPEKGHGFGEGEHCREVSDAIFHSEKPRLNPSGGSTLLINWGQFVDHDFALIRGNGHVNFGADESHPGYTIKHSPPLTQDYSITSSDKIQLPGQPISFSNKVTHYLDLSQVYGTTDAVSGIIRTHKYGLMWTRQEGGYEYLPRYFDNKDFDVVPGRGMEDHFVGGDLRANEQIFLTALQTLFVLEHNRLANYFRKKLDLYDDEELYQKARKWNIAQYQSIVFSEWLPRIIGKQNIRKYEGYDPELCTRINLFFSTSAYRFGHSGISEHIERIDKYGKKWEHRLVDAFVQPNALVKHDGIGSIFKGSSHQQYELIGNKLTTSLRSLMFESLGHGMDLACNNMVRQTDHGIGHWNQYREYFGLKPHKDFKSANLLDHAKLEHLYGNVTDVHPWVMGLSEIPVHKGSKLGETYTYALQEQFHILRTGDRFYYENPFQPEPFSDGELKYLNNVKIADIVTRNTFLNSEKGSPNYYNDGFQVVGTNHYGGGGDDEDYDPTYGGYAPYDPHKDEHYEGDKKPYTSNYDGKYVEKDLHENLKFLRVTLDYTKTRTIPKRKKAYEEKKEEYGGNGHYEKRKVYERGATYEANPYYKPPEYQPPAYKEPSYQPPSYKEPEYKEPAYKPPVYKEPEYKEPAYKEPEHKEEPEPYYAPEEEYVSGPEPEGSQCVDGVAFDGHGVEYGTATFCFEKAQEIDICAKDSDEEDYHEGGYQQPSYNEHPPQQYGGSSYGGYDSGGYSQNPYYDAPQSDEDISKRQGYGYPSEGYGYQGDGGAGYNPGYQSGGAGYNPPSGGYESGGAGYNPPTGGYESGGGNGGGYESGGGYENGGGYGGGYESGGGYENGGGYNPPGGGYENSGGYEYPSGGGNEYPMGSGNEYPPNGEGYGGYQQPTYEEPAYQQPTYEEPAHPKPPHEEPAHPKPPHEEPAHPKPPHKEPELPHYAPEYETDPPKYEEEPVYYEEKKPVYYGNGIDEGVVKITSIFKNKHGQVVFSEWATIQELFPQSSSKKFHTMIGAPLPDYHEPNFDSEHLTGTWENVKGRGSTAGFFAPFDLDSNYITTDIYTILKYGEPKKPETTFCKHNCGGKYDDYEGYVCYCDSVCTKYGDCCEDACKNCDICYPHYYDDEHEFETRPLEGETTESADKRAATFGMIGGISLGAVVLLAILVKYKRRKSSYQRVNTTPSRSDSQVPIAATPKLTHYDSTE